MPFHSAFLDSERGEQSGISNLDDVTSLDAKHHKARATQVSCKTYRTQLPCSVKVENVPLTADV